MTWSPLLRLDFEQGSGNKGRRIVDEHVQAPESLTDRLPDPLDLGGVRNIAPCQEDLSTLSGEFHLESSGGLLGRVVIHNHVIAGVSQGERDGASGADRTTCDESDWRHGLEPTVRPMVSKLDRDSDTGDERDGFDGKGMSGDRCNQGHRMRHS